MVLLDDLDKTAIEREASRRILTPSPRPRLSTDTLPAYSQEYIAEGSDGSIETESSVSATTTNYLELPHVNGHRPVNGNGFPNGHSYSPNQRRNGTTPHDPQPGPSSTPTLRTSRSMTSMPPDHPVNYISVEGSSGSIRGTYRVDPLIPLSNPSSILRGASLRPDNRDNLALSVTNGAIKVDIHVLPPPSPSQNMPRCRIKLVARNGSVSVRIPTPGYPVSLHLTIHNGSAHLRLPRSFLGPLTSILRTSALGASPTLAKRLTILSDPSGGGTSRQRYAFVGDYRATGWDRSPKAWRGDELTLDVVNGGVRLSYVDDPESDEIVSYGQWSSILGSVM